MPARLRMRQRSPNAIGMPTQFWTIEDTPPWNELSVIPSAVAVNSMLTMAAVRLNTTWSVLQSANEINTQSGKWGMNSIKTYDFEFGLSSHVWYGKLQYQFTAKPKWPSRPDRNWTANFSSLNFGSWTSRTLQRPIDGWISSESLQQ